MLNRAILSQAKKSNKSISTCQRKLYDEDPGFLMPKSIYTFSDCCRQPERFFPQRWGDRCKALKYLILAPQNIHFISLPWKNNFSLSFSLTTWLFMLGFKGLNFSRKPYRTNGWSAIVWDLIKVAGKTITGKKYGYTPRDSYPLFLLNYLDNDSEYCTKSEAEDGGIPIMWIIVKNLEIEKGRK